MFVMHAHYAKGVFSSVLKLFDDEAFAPTNVVLILQGYVLMMPSLE